MYEGFVLPPRPYPICKGKIFSLSLRVFLFSVRGSVMIWVVVFGIVQNFDLLLDTTREQSVDPCYPSVTLGCRSTSGQGSQNKPSQVGRRDYPISEYRRREGPTSTCNQRDIKTPVSQMK